jgi:hypothetical protein
MEFAILGLAPPNSPIPNSGYSHSESSDVSFGDDSSDDDSSDDNSDDDGSSKNGLKWDIYDVLSSNEEDLTSMIYSTELATVI